MVIKFKPEMLLKQKSTGIIWYLLDIDRANEHYYMQTANRVKLTIGDQTLPDEWIFDFTREDIRNDFEEIPKTGLANRLYR